MPLDEKRAKIGLWQNMRAACCVFLGIRSMLSVKKKPALTELCILLIVLP